MTPFYTISHDSKLSPEQRSYSRPHFRRAVSTDYSQAMFKVVSVVPDLRHALGTRDIRRG